MQENISNSSRSSYESTGCGRRNAATQPTPPWKKHTPRRSLSTWHRLWQRPLLSLATCDQTGNSLSFEADAALICCAATHSRCARWGALAEALAHVRSFEDVASLEAAFVSLQGKAISEGSEAAAGFGYNPLHVHIGTKRVNSGEVDPSAVPSVQPPPPAAISSVSTSSLYAPPPSNHPSSVWPLTLTSHHRRITAVSNNC